MQAKLADRHLPQLPFMRNALREAIEFEQVIASMTLVALLPNNRWMFFEYRDFPKRLESFKAYARETGRTVLINGGISGDSALAIRANYYRRQEAKSHQSNG